MKTAAVLALSLLLTPAALAQSAPPASAPPPPALHDPGVKARAPAPASTPAATLPATRADVDRTVPALPAMHDGARDARGEAPPEVRVHQSGNDTVQEYTRNGQLYMVVITPRGGVPQTYLVDPEGRLVDEHGQKPVRPVMYKLLEWGKSKPAAPAEATTGGE